MDESLARMVAVSAWRSTRELADLVPFEGTRLAGRLPGPGARHRQGTGVISTNVLNPVFALHPELEQEFERNVSRYGRTS
jgi:hypothetical protein